VRTPTSAAPPPLHGADRLYLVRYVDSGGETASRLFRQAPAAARFGDAVRQAGGAPRTYVTTARWSEVFG
jgi:hypothetical protein